MVQFKKKKKRNIKITLVKKKKNFFSLIENKR